MIDLSQLPAPDIIETIDFETLVRQRKSHLIALYTENEREQIAKTLQYESEPIVKLIQENAYREMLLRQRINEACKAVMVAYSRGADLDNLAANNNVKRLIVYPGDNSTVPPTPTVYESDEDLRKRVPEAFEGLSVAGPVKSYEFHALSADGRVADAKALSPSPANVTVTILSKENDGTANQGLLDIVSTALNDDLIRPVADRLKIQSATIINYEIRAELFIYRGPEYELIKSEAEKRLIKYINSQRRIGRDIRRSAIYAALHAEGVQRVELLQPNADILISDEQASFCTNYEITLGGTDE